VYFPAGEGETHRKFAIAWRGDDSYYHDEYPDGMTNTVVVRSGKTTILATSNNAQAEARIFRIVHPDAYSLDRASHFFPVLRHFWDDTLADAVVRQEFRKHPQLLRRLAEAAAGPGLSDAEVVSAVLKLHGGHSSREDQAQFVAVPQSVREPPEGNLAFGCRVGSSGWFSIVELDQGTLRLKRVISFVNKKGMPDEVGRELHGAEPASTERTWELQAKYAHPWLRKEYSEHLELPRGIVMPMRVDSWSYDEDGTDRGHSVYRVSEVRVDPELPEGQFAIEIPEGTRVLDGTYDPVGFIGIPYTQDSACTQEEWEEILREGMKGVNEELERRGKLQEMVGGPAPELTASAWINGPPVRPSDLKGTYVILEFSSLTCGPCVREAPALPRLSEKLEAVGGQLLCVFTARDSREDVRGFAEQNGLNFPICISTGEGWGDIFASYQVHYIPNACMIDRNGGFLAQGDAWELFNFVERLHELGERPRANASSASD